MTNNENGTGSDEANSTHYRMSASTLALKTIQEITAMKYIHRDLIKGAIEHTANANGMGLTLDPEYYKEVEALVIKGLRQVGFVSERENPGVDAPRIGEEEPRGADRDGAVPASKKPSLR